jgi:hypothetical protein
MTRIADLFAREIDRRIEEVIKVDDPDEARIREELSEYVVTPSLAGQQNDILEAYMEAFRRPHEGTAIWVSGFFGSGKSSFAKMLGIAIQDRDLQGTGAAGLLAQKMLEKNNKRGPVLLKQVTEQVPTEAVIFDVSTDRGIRTGNQSISEIMYRLFLQNLGYARDLDLAELEITLEADGRLPAFQAKYTELYKQDWDHEKGKPAIAIGRASAVMHALEPQTYNAQDSWVKGARDRGDITPSLLADRCLALMKVRRPSKRNLLFVIDEVGQFVARDAGKLEDLRAVVERLGQRGGGKIWVMVTSQEALSELVSGLDSTRIELPKVKDRFPLQVHLEPSDIAAVTGERVLAKKATAEATLRTLFEDNRARLTSHTRIHAPNVKLPELTGDDFIRLYPLVPYQIDMIISIVSGMRMQGGASKHVGGANRTIIKLAQQLLIHRDVNLQDHPVGTLVTLDRIYDLVAGNIASELRQKIDSISDSLHPKASAVAKAVCLMQFEQRIPRTAENIAATLHPSVQADSQLVEVKAALEALVAIRALRLGEDGGYRIPTPAEDDWEKVRGDLTPKQAERARIHAERVADLWSPTPSHNLLGVKPFKAGLVFNRNVVFTGDIPVHVALAQDDDEWRKLSDEWRQRSREEKTALFWVARQNDAIERLTTEVFRSTEVLSRKERNVSTRAEATLVSEEKRKRENNILELRRLLKTALLAGTLYFRGNDRSPDRNAADVSKACSGVLATVLPEVFDRFKDAAAKVGQKDLEALLKAQSLHGLPDVFTSLHLIRDEKGKQVFRWDSGPLGELHARIENKAKYGETVSGRSLADELGKEPFGWDFDVVRLLVASLLRAGKVVAVSGGAVIDDALSSEAKRAFSDNNAFKSATFRPKVAPGIEVLIAASDNMKDVFGEEVSELESGVVARAIRQKVQQHEAPLRDMHMLLLTQRLPGASVLEQALEQMQVIGTGTEEVTIDTFNANFGAIKEAIRREALLRNVLTDPALQDIRRGREAAGRMWTFLKAEPDLPDELEKDAADLTDLLARETFFESLPRIDQLAKKIEDAYTARFDRAVAERRTAYEAAVQYVHALPEWPQLDETQQTRVMAPLTVADPGRSTPIPQVRAETQACSSRQADVVANVLELVDGNRIVRIRLVDYFGGGIDTTEQLEAAIQALRDACERLIGDNKKVLVQ